MKKLFIVGALLLGLISCEKEEFKNCKIISSKLFVAKGGNNPSQHYFFVWKDKTQTEVNLNTWESYKKGDCY